MREVKVQCDCGQKFKFDVEPVNGLMPYTVACPICGADGTQKANAILATPPTASVPPASPPPPPPVATATSGGGRVLTAPTAVSSRQPAPAPVHVSMGSVAPASIAASAFVVSPPPPPAPAPIQAAAPPQASSHPPRLRINSTANAAPPAAAAVAEAPAVPVPRKVPTSVRAPSGPLKESSAGFTAGFAKGVLGAFVGAVIGGALYYVIMGYTGFRIGLMAIGAGFLAGLGARFLGKEGSNELGVISATMTLVCVIGAQYGVAWRWWHEDVSEREETSREMFAALSTEAKKVVAAVPTGSDREIRVYLAKEAMDGENGTPDLSQVSNEDIQEFKQEHWPQMRDIATGAIGYEAWKKKQAEEAARAEAAKTEEERDEEDKGLKFFFLLILLKKANLISLVAGAGLAYKMSSDAPG